MRTTVGSDNITIDVHLTTQDPAIDRAEIRNGLLSSPRVLPTKYLYDDRGSELFEQICELPEYYQTRTEFQILVTCADKIIARSDADELVELGSGAATKTRVLLDAMDRAGQLNFYVPFDVSEGIVRRVSQELVEEYAALKVHGVVGDFLSHLEHIPDGGKRLVVFLGGTIGNLDDVAGAAFLSSVNKAMELGDHFLLSVQFVTEVNRLEAAYNDSKGVTAKFNKNMISVMQEMVRADFSPDAFDHVARFNHVESRIEIFLRSNKRQAVIFQDLDLVLSLENGEEIRTEISTKYDRKRAEQLLADANFELVEWYVDSDELLGLALAKKL
tara:strand:+ start:4880 stop:5866 length:987 start_codon:yes stop_codon:yes gene_type:complete